MFFFFLDLPSLHQNSSIYSLTAVPPIPDSEPNSTFSDYESDSSNATSSYSDDDFLPIPSIDPIEKNNFKTIVNHDMRISTIRFNLENTQPKPFDTYYCVSTRWLQSFFDNDGGFASTFGNFDIVDPINKAQLIFDPEKVNPLDHVTMVPPIAWKCLVEWYNPYPREIFELPRTVITLDSDGKPVFNLYPFVFRIKIFTRLSPLQSYAETRAFNGSKKCSLLYKFVKNSFGLPKGIKNSQIRFWGVAKEAVTSSLMETDYALAQISFNMVKPNLVAIPTQFQTPIRKSKVLSKFQYLIAEVKESTSATCKWPSESTVTPVPPPPPPRKINNPSSTAADEEKKEEPEVKNAVPETTQGYYSGPAPPLTMSKSKTYVNFKDVNSTRHNQVVKGTMGLGNLGNTCYMNSALQCITHIPELAEYFLSGYYTLEINRDNPIGYDGRIAEAFGDLFQHLFGEERSGTSYSCRNFRSVVGRYNSSFGGYQQQDSQEFLAFLLDALHEDLNRIIKKPATEKPEIKNTLIPSPDVIADLAEESWRRHKLRNDSVILDLLGGLYKSTLICPTCGLTSITFDPFMDLTLPLPSQEYVCSETLLFPKNSQPFMFSFAVDPSMSLKQFKQYIGKHCNIEPKALHFVDVFQKTFYRNITDDTSVVSELFNNKDDIYGYEADLPLDAEIDVKKDFYNDFNDESPENNLLLDSPPIMERPFLVPVYMSVVTNDISEPPARVPLPFYITLLPSEASSPVLIAQKIIIKLVSLSQNEYFKNVLYKLENDPENWQRIIGFSPHVCYRKPVRAGAYRRFRGLDNSADENPFTGKDWNISATFEERIKEILRAHGEISDSSKNSVTASATFDDEDYLPEGEEEDDEDEEEDEACFNIINQQQYQVDNHVGENLELPPSYESVIGENNSKNSTPDYESEDDAFSASSTGSTKPALPSNPGNSKLRNETFLYKNDDDSSDNEENDKKDPKPTAKRTGLLGGSENFAKSTSSDSMEATPDSKGLDLENKNEASASPAKSDDEIMSDTDSSFLPNNNRLPDYDENDLSYSINGKQQNASLSPSPSHTSSVSPSNSRSHSRASSSSSFISFDRSVNNPIYPSNHYEPQQNHYINRNFQQPIQETKDPEDVDNKMIVGPSGLIAIVMPEETYLKSIAKLDSYDGLPRVEPPEVTQRKKAIQSKMDGNEEGGATIYDCLALFSKTEILGENDLWYCSNCSEFKAAASKTIELWKTPDILVIQLKRFSNFGSYRDKIHDVVKFPIEGLDLTDIIRTTRSNSRFQNIYENINPNKSEDSSVHQPLSDMSTDNEEERIVYDLFAVDNHYGSLHGGHYTAYAKNFEDNKWYYFDDSRVQPADPKESVSGNAYLLFYRRRVFTGDHKKTTEKNELDGLLGGETMKEIWKKIEERRVENVRPVHLSDHEDVKSEKSDDTDELSPVAPLTSIKDTQKTDDNDEQSDDMELDNSDEVDQLTEKDIDDI